MRADDEKRLADLEAFKRDYEVDQRVKTAVKLRCAAAWASILGFIAVVFGVITEHWDVARDASKAALKIIIERLWS